MDRRAFLRSIAATAATAVPFAARLARAADLPFPGNMAAYGPLLPALDETTGLPLLRLPAGFRYLSFGWTGDPMIGGRVTPPSHDGMGVFAAGRDFVLLVRNHEVEAGAPFGGLVYDPAAGGGTTSLSFDTRRGQFLGARDSLSGTSRNCAGGPTPWGSWLTCEETVTYGTRPHGYVFEVPASGFGSAEPLRDMGRFSHEAVAVDPVTGHVYETEDAGRTSGFYRFVPNSGSLADGGRLFMLKVRGRALVDLSVSYTVGTEIPTEWVRIDEPDDPSSTAPANVVWSQGRARGAATFARLEGCWYEASDDRVYVVATEGGTRQQGQVWAYSPRRETITLVLDSSSTTAVKNPDNVTSGPGGGLVICQDGGGGGVQSLYGLTAAGGAFAIAQNNIRLSGERNGLTGDFTDGEWAGACYSPDGRWLFANIQRPGITFAITGPW
jgi:secreted PhoX family phosphatase